MAASAPVDGTSPDNGLARSAAPIRVAWSDRPSVVARRAITLLQTEGLVGLVRGFGRLVVAVRRSVYRSSTFRVYDLYVEEAASMPAMPPFDGMSVHVIASRDDASKLAERGYEDVLVLLPSTGRRLDSGAVAACAFVGREFVSIDWIAFTEEARRAIDRTPYDIDFAHGEVMSAAAYTVPRFRNRGIGTYRVSVQARYLQVRGYRVCRSTIGATNVASQRCVERYGAQFHTIVRSRRFLWWRHWEKTRLS
jgi:GNAT superfamily N-acetyltransferase